MKSKLTLQDSTLIHKVYLAFKSKATTEKEKEMLLHLEMFLLETDIILENE